MKWIKRGRFYSLTTASEQRFSHTQLPVADISDSKSWRIYYSSRNRAGQSLPYFLDLEPGHPGNIRHESEQPLLALGAAGSFDEHGVMPTAILDRQGCKYLYYVGWSTRSEFPYQNAIGLAISEDGGDSFKRWSDGPVIASEVAGSVFTGTLHVYDDGSILHGYYLSCVGWINIGEKWEPRYRLNYASSVDGFYWHCNSRVAIDFADQHEGGIAAATVIRLGDRFLMWYCYRADRDYRLNPANSYRIGMAESFDAVSWSRCDNQAGIEIGNEGWDSEMLCYPSVVRWENQLYLFYNGNGFGQSGIGYATSDLNDV